MRPVMTTPTHATSETTAATRAARGGGAAFGERLGVDGAVVDHAGEVKAAPALVDALRC